MTPTGWLVIFDRTSSKAWLRWRIWGRYKHVGAVGYVRELQVWVSYEVYFGHTGIRVIPDAAAEPFLDALTRDADVVWMPARPGPAVWFRFGFWCVPAVKHLLGLRSGALRPDTLYRDCLRNGGIPVDEVLGAPAGRPEQRPAVQAAA